MKLGCYRGERLAAPHNDAGLFSGHVVLRSYYPESPPQREECAPAPVPSLQLAEIAHGCGRYCEQPMSWSTRLFGLAGTALVVGLVLTGALFTWNAVYQPVRVRSQPLTVIELISLAAPPEPIRNVATGPNQSETQETEPEPVSELTPVPLVQLPAPYAPAQEPREPAKIVDPGRPVPEMTAPRNVVAPTASQFASNARPNWEGLVLAHLERFRRYPPRARAARQQGTVMIRFRVNRAGMVLSSAVAKKSGSLDLDHAALETLQRAQPLPPVPMDMPDEVELSVPVEYYLR